MYMNINGEILGGKKPGEGGRRKREYGEEND
jgi:hypothetical protein